MKPALKRWIIALAIQLVTMVWTTLFNLSEESFEPFFTFPPIQDEAMHSIFWYSAAIAAPIILVPVGYALGREFIRLFVRMARPGGRIQRIGFARVQLDPNVQRKQLATRVFFGVLLCINFWILLFQYDLFPMLIKPEYHGRMYNSDGTMLNFPMIPWYWFPNAITSILFSICFMILDSGLVFVKRVPEHPDFSDTERVGNILWSIVKGYAGIVVVLNFAMLLSSPLGQEGSLVLYPLLAAMHVFFIVTTIDLFKPWGQRLAFNAVKASRNTELIGLEYKTSPVADPKDVYG